MKKITLLVAAFVGVTSFAQSSLKGNTENAGFAQNPNAECSQEFSSETLQLANAISEIDGTGVFFVANDFVVESGSSLELQSATFLLLTTASDVNDITDANISLYTDDGAGAPGASFISSDLTEVENVTHPDLFAGFPMYRVTYEFDDEIIISNDGATDETYWLALNTTSSSGSVVYWVGYPRAEADPTNVNYQSSDGGVSYEVIINTDDPEARYDSEWLLEGDCNPLSVSDNALSQVSVYPNPASDVLNIETPATVEVNSVAIYDVLGKRSNVSLVNGQVNVSNLANGVYILSLETSAGTLTQKIVKN